MTMFVALLRAVNVGGTGVLPMKELASLCTKLGLEEVRTYIQSGNVVFRSRLPKNEIVIRMEDALAKSMGKPVDVIIRTSAELQSALNKNPFPQGNPSQLAIMFLAQPAAKNLLSTVVIPGSEELWLSDQEIYIHYPDGVGRSKLKFPPTLIGTARNLNTVAKLVEMTSA